LLAARPRANSDVTGLERSSRHPHGTPIGYSAGTGYDLPSGIGTPILDQLIVDLAAS